jgi:hypothetical protein
MRRARRIVTAVALLLLGFLGLLVVEASSPAAARSNRSSTPRGSR